MYRRIAVAKLFVTQLKYGASSSIIILDYDLIHRKFKVIKRVEVPRSEYSYDTAVNLVVELNDQYNPAWIYADAGAGEVTPSWFNLHRRIKIINREKIWNTEM